MTILTKFALQQQPFNSRPQQQPFQLMGGFANVSPLHGMGANSGIAQAANAAQRNPNPVSKLSPGAPGLATTAGVSQLAQQAQQNNPQQQNPLQQQNVMPKMGSVEAHKDWLEMLIPVFKAQVKKAEVQTSASQSPASGSQPLSNAGSNPAKSAPSVGKGIGNGNSPGRVLGQNFYNGQQQGQGGNFAQPGNSNGGEGQETFMGQQVGAFGIVRPGWASLKTAAEMAQIVTWRLKQSAMQPVPGLTANQAVPKPGMGAPPPPGMPSMPPPNGGAPIPGIMGQPSIDPATGAPIPGPNDPSMQQPPVGPDGMPMGGAGGPPPQQTQPDPKTGAPTTSPMQDPPPLPLPGNPPVPSPRAQPTQRDMHQMSTTQSLMNDKNEAEMPNSSHEAVEDIQDEAMALGSKTASSNLKSGFWKFPGLGVEKLAAYSDLSPFSRGFFVRCAVEGVDPAAAIEKVGMDYGVEAASELRGALEKVAINFGGVGQGIGKAWTGARNWLRGTPTASQAANTTTQAASPGITSGAWQNGWNQVRGQAVITGLGALGGGMAGGDLGFGGDHTDVLGFRLNHRGMLAGAAASNPYLRRMADRTSSTTTHVPYAMPRGALSMPMTGFRNAGIGAGAGTAADVVMDRGLGIDTQGKFGRMGTWAGLGLGMAGRGTHLLKNQAAMRPGFNPANSFLQKADHAFGSVNKGLSNFSTEWFRGVVSPMLYPLRAGRAYATGAPMPALFAKRLTGQSAARHTPEAVAQAGRFDRHMAAARGTTAPNQINPNIANRMSGEGNAAHLLDAAGKPVSLTSGQMGTMGGPFGWMKGVRPGAVGRMLGIGTLGATAVGGGLSALDNRISDTVHNSAGETAAELLPELKDHAANFMDQYLNEKGLINQNGQLDLAGTLKRTGGGMFDKAMGHTDGIFQALGMNPETMSPLQKLMILGGALGAGGGVAAGAPMLAGAGGASALTALLPHFLANQTQAQQAQGAPGTQGQRPGVAQPGQVQPNALQARNEWLAQLFGQQQGEQYGQE